MKKFKFLLMALAMIPMVAFVSCGDDDETPIDIKPQLTANAWECDKLVTSVPDLTQIENITSVFPDIETIQEQINDLVHLFPFAEGVEIGFDANNKFWLNGSEIGTYRLNGTVLTTVSDGIEIAYDVTFPEANEMMLSINKAFLAKNIATFIPAFEGKELLITPALSQLKLEASFANADVEETNEK